MTSPGPWLSTVIAVTQLFTQPRADWTYLPVEERLACVRGLVAGLGQLADPHDRREIAIEAPARLFDVVLTMNGQ